MGARGTRSTEIFAVTWPNGGMTVVTASGRTEALRILLKEKRDRPSGRFDHGESRLPDLLPVTGLEIGVGPRRRLNAPTFYRVRMPGQTIAWTMSGRQMRHSHRTPADDVEEPSPTFRMCIWSYVWNASELVFFDAPGFDSACDRALARAGSWGFSRPADRHVVRANLEPVDRIGLCVRPPSLKSAPLRYWAWVEGVKVGWPPIRSDESVASAPVPPASPGSPLAAYALPPGLRYTHKVGSSPARRSYRN
jgi:hypothetical protein